MGPETARTCSGLITGLAVLNGGADLGTETAGKFGAAAVGLTTRDSAGLGAGAGLGAEAIATLGAVATIPAVHFHVARDYGYRGWQLHAYVTLPAILPQVITALRVAAGIAWVVVVAAEMVGCQDGLGYGIYEGRNGQDTARRKCTHDTQYA